MDAVSQLQCVFMDPGMSSCCVCILFVYMLLTSCLCLRLILWLTLEVNLLVYEQILLVWTSSSDHYTSLSTDGAVVPAVTWDLQQHHVLPGRLRMWLRPSQANPGLNTTQLIWIKAGTNRPLRREKPDRGRLTWTPGCRRCCRHGGLLHTSSSCRRRRIRCSGWMKLVFPAAEETQPTEFLRKRLLKGQCC